MKYCYDIIIIGGGAAGLAAAISVKNKNPGMDVLVLEKQHKLGEKLSVTGKGRCNISNKACEHFAEVRDFMGTLGIEFVEEAEGRLYPKGMDACGVVHLLEQKAKALGVEFALDRPVEKITPLDNGFGIETRDLLVTAEKLLIAAGGKSYPKLGTTGDGYVMARKLDHTVNTLIPGLTGVEVAEDIGEYKGIRARALVRLYNESLCENEKLIYEEHGEVQFRGDAISGIVIMNMSLKVRNGNEYKLHIITDEESCLKGKEMQFRITGLRGWKEAQITCGGVDLNEIDEKTGESKLRKGLYFAGEILDYQGPCGGFNLNNAWYTGIRAGRSMADVFCE